MKRTRFGESQIVGILKQAELAGTVFREEFIHCLPGHTPERLTGGITRR